MDPPAERFKRSLVRRMLLASAREVDRRSVNVCQLAVRNRGRDFPRDDRSMRHPLINRVIPSEARDLVYGHDSRVGYRTRTQGLSSLSLLGMAERSTLARDVTVVSWTGEGNKA